jgi:hypothetical protein
MQRIADAASGLVAHFFSEAPDPKDKKKVQGRIEALDFRNSRVLLSVRPISEYPYFISF